MAFEEVPSDLINQSQIGFREDAGLSSFNPQHPTLKSLPTVQHSISALDPSSPRLRCKHCKGKLLRGTHSLICIYCGQCQAKDLPPEPIFFISTTAYRWLLQSLNLNPLERIGGFFEENRRIKAGTPVEDGKTLAELLDVQIAWRDELEKTETGFVNKIFEHNSSLNIGKVGLGDFVTGSGRDSGSDASEKHPVTSKNDRSDDFEDHENLSLFQKVAPPGTAPVSPDLSGDASSGHDAEIQYVNYTTQKEGSKTAFVSSDLSHNGSSGHDGETPSVSSRTQNEDSKPTASISSGLGRDSSSGDDADIQTLNSRTPNTDSKPTASISSGLIHDGSSEHDAEIQSVLSWTHNEDSKTADVSSDLRDDASYGHDAEIQPVNFETQNKNSKAFAAVTSDLNRDPSSGDDAVQSGNSRMQNEDLKSVDPFVGSEVDRSAHMDSGSR